MIPFKKLYNDHVLIPHEAPVNKHIKGVIVHVAMQSLVCSILESMEG